ncbi:hypothetical protein OESDEN_06516 [Oesophagostomum dentatum]|uniref:Uncharacterized protein n=1 Tax=Oesophagostomum dentatum TaxID=61180 RepID=A0A0B1TCM2_OESDE|nr:hypothetical protein OESDEN_06516 [Oesophagostomum dentatum]
MQYTVVSFHQSRNTVVIPRSDVEGDVHVNSMVRAQWHGRWCPAQIRAVGTKRYCESKARGFNKGNDAVDVKPGVGVRQPLVSSFNENRPTSSGDNRNGDMARFCKEIVLWLESLEDRMPSPSLQRQILSEMQTIREKVEELHDMLVEVLRRLPPVP